MLAHKPIRYLAYAQLSTALLIAFCFALVHPAHVQDPNGLSFYGIHKLTVVPYTLGFLLYVAFISLAANQLLATHGHLARLIGCLRLISLLAAGVLLFPYAISRDIQDIHIAFSTGLFATELLLTVWLVRHTDSAALDWSLLAAQTLIGLVTMLSLLNVLRVELYGETAFALLFGFNLIRFSSKLLRDDGREAGEIPALLQA